MSDLLSEPVEAQDDARVPKARRWALVALGIACIGLGGIGVVVPGIPTTVFLIAASWCFTRSCPWLEDRLIRNRFFGPYLRYLDGKTAMPKRVMWTTLAVMWAAIVTSTVLLFLSGLSIALVLLVPVAGAVGTFFLVRLARSTRDTLAPRRHGSVVRIAHKRHLIPRTQERVECAMSQSQ